MKRTLAKVDREGVTPQPQWTPFVPVQTPRGVTLMVESIWPNDAQERRHYLSVAYTVASFLASRALDDWKDLDVNAFVSAYAGTAHQAVQLCLDLTGMLPWLINTGELSRADATRLWLDLYRRCPQHADARASIELTFEHLGDQELLRVEEAPTMVVPIPAEILAGPRPQNC